MLMTSSVSLELLIISKVENKYFQKVLFFKLNLFYTWSFSASIIWNVIKVNSNVLKLISGSII
jgi:hypothetical protein